MLFKLFDSTDCFGLVAVILGVQIQVLIQVFFFVALVGVEEDVLIIVAGGVGKVGVNGRVDGVGGGRVVGYSGWCKREVEKVGGGVWC